MKPAFPIPVNIEANATADILAIHQTRVRDRKATALIMVTAVPSHRYLLLYAHGILAGVYCEQADSCRASSSTEISSIFQHAGVLIKISTLPDPAARQVWLACESPRQALARGTDGLTWKQQLRNWKLEGVNGLVGVESERAGGFLLLQSGDPLTEETAIIVREGGLADAFDPQGPWESTLHELNFSSPAAECMRLRLSAGHWSRGIMESYKNVAGERFQIVLARELQAQVRHWQWNIQVTERGIEDRHFFASPEATAQANRALFLGIGAQISFAMGSFIAQRILTEIFEELRVEERAVLEAHRLVPAAFSE